MSSGASRAWSNYLLLCAAVGLHRWGLLLATTEIVLFFAKEQHLWWFKMLLSLLFSACT